MTTYKVSQDYRYDVVIVETRFATMRAEVEAVDEREARRLANNILAKQMYEFTDGDGVVDEYSKYGKLRIEEKTEPSEAAKMEAMGFSPLFDLQEIS